MNQSNELLEEAAGAYCEGRFQDAFPVYEKLAATGNVGAICGMAQMYLRGEGVCADVEQGLALLRRAVGFGHANSAFNLGALYRSDDCGVPKNSEFSKQFFHRAKELGCELSVDGYLCCSRDLAEEGSLPNRAGFGYGFHDRPNI